MTALFRAALTTGLVLVMGLLGGCSGSDDPAAPPRIRYGEDVCSRCAMIINEEAHAAAYRTAAGEVRVFDDLGEMLLDHRERQDSVDHYFVHDFETREWLHAETAFYVAGGDVRTPMGFGVVALASRSRAEAVRERVGGHVVTFRDLLEQPQLTAPPKHERH
ncbi:MAG: nitrous oxide reductase accessory protein NosL [Chloroflexi bacterium]|nr:nitrous oxide reductase accessory protein NosL [Chloroflexota bacterium]